MRGKVVIIGIAIFVALGLIALFAFGTKRTEKVLEGNLTFIGVFDPPQAIRPIIDAYTKLHPKVSINYVELNAGTYEQDFLNSLAGSNPPDIVMVHNSWLPKHFDKLVPYGESQFSLGDFRKLFPTVAEQDFAPDRFVYALPLYIDTLATYYNQDIFDNAGVATPPSTWTELESIVPKLRELDSTGRILKPAAAIGGSNRSINRGSDILGLLMLQTGTEMTNRDFSGATFNSGPGQEALDFYIKFANPIDSAYTWNDDLAYSLDSFAAGDSAIMFNYSHQIAFLREKNPFLNFRVIPMLQPESRTQDVNYANYWGLAATVQSRNREVAQDFIAFATTNTDNSRTYLNKTNRPPALRSLIGQYSNHPDLNVFARQALTARSWPQVDNKQIDAIFSGMINSIITGKKSSNKALQEAASAVTDIMSRRIR